MLIPEVGEGIDLNRNPLSQKQRVRMGGRAGGTRPSKRFHRGGGGGAVQLCFCTAPMRGTHNPATQGELYERVFSLLGQILHSWVGQYDRGQQKRSRALSLAKHSHMKLSHAYLLKSWSLLPGPGEGDAIGSNSSDPHRFQHLCKY